MTLPCLEQLTVDGIQQFQEHFQLSLTSSHLLFSWSTGAEQMEMGCASLQQTWLEMGSFVMFVEDVFAPGLWSGRPVVVPEITCSFIKTDPSPNLLHSVFSHLFFGLGIGGWEELHVLFQEHDIQGSICMPMCSLGVLTYSSVSITLSAITMVITTSPFQVLFHLAETSMPTMGGGVVSVVLAEV